MLLISPNFNKKLWLQLRSHLGNSSVTIKLFGIFSKKFNARLAHKDSTICIEGFPRSANTYMMSLLTIADPTLKHTSHTHLAGNVLLAIKNDIPAVVLIRKPLDCILSYAIYEPRISIESHIKNYLIFYQQLLKHRDHYLLVHFDQLISKPENTINSINQRFDLNFVYQESLEEEKALINRWCETEKSNDSMEDLIARPSEERARKKKLLEQKLSQNVKGLVLLDQANTLYAIYTNPKQSIPA